MIQLTLTLKMTTAQVVETSVTVNNNSPTQDYVHPHDQTQPTLEMFVLKIATHKIKHNDLTSPFSSPPHVTSHDSPKWRAC